MREIEQSRSCRPGGGTPCAARASHRTPTDSTSSGAALAAAEPTAEPVARSANPRADTLAFSCRLWKARGSHN